MRARVVMKFGGTSVGSAAAMTRAAEHVARERNPLVVVSAVGGVTNLLLEAGQAAVAGDASPGALAEIRRRHAVIARELALEPGPIEPLLVELDRLLLGIAMLRELSPRTKDALVSLGERLSVRLFAALLRRRGLEARAFDAWDLGLETDANFGKAEPVPDFGDRIRASLAALPEATVPVVTGYIGRSPKGDVTTLGRGGSDFSAALFGVGAGAEEIQIWTDVRGFLRADPRIVPEPALIPAMRFDEAAELAFFGAKVLHPRTIEPARRLGIPVRVLGTFEVDPAGKPAAEQGTLIGDAAPIEPVRALALQQRVQSLQIRSSGMLDAPGFLARVFEVFGRHGISIDVVATSEVSVSLTFDSDGAALEQAVREVALFADVERYPERSILCLVGAGLRGEPALQARVFGALAEARLPIEVISQGASRINLTLVTEPEVAPAAMRALHAVLWPNSRTPVRP